jgi:hypothetical protein
VSSQPERPKIYHITHVRNLAPIATEGGLVSDRTMSARGGPSKGIGISVIKARWIHELAIDCHPGIKVGDCVPFYFCPRSVMLYVIYRGNHEELAYRDGQDPIVHLQADMHAVVGWARERGVRWAFSLSNAGSYIAEFRASLDDLGDLSWTSIEARDFRDPSIKEGKQAEFLLHERFPFELVERIGVRTEATRALAVRALAGARHRPVVEVLPEWYY